MKKVEVLGTGCYKCIQLESLLHEVFMELGLEEQIIERIDDEHIIRKFMPAEELPGLVIDGRLVCSSIVPSKEQLKSWFSTN